MASGEAKPGVSASAASRAERLVRALTGVADARIETAPNGRITAVYVVPEAGFSSHRVTQNVRSGLMAATGIILEPGRVYVVGSIPGPEGNREQTSAPALESAPLRETAPLRAIEPGAAYGDPLAPVPADEPEPAPVSPPLAPAASHHNGNNGSQPVDPKPPAWPAFNHYANTPRVELLEMQRDDTGAPRCRIIIESDGRRFLGTATNTRGSETTADLIAGAVLHALETLIPSDLHFDGMADVIIAGQRHVVVSLRNVSDWSHAFSGAAAVHDSVEHAIADAVLNAVGIGIAHTYSFMTRSVIHR